MAMERESQARLTQGGQNERLAFDREDHEANRVLQREQMQMQMLTTVIQALMGLIQAAMTALTSVHQTSGSNLAAVNQNTFQSFNRRG
jgi:hypothetical protein